MEPSSLPDAAELPVSATRRPFIRGIAAAGASTAAAVALDRAGVLDLSPRAAPAQGPNAFSDFEAIAASAEDALRVPAGCRANVIIGYGATFATADGTRPACGSTNDFLAFLPLPAGSANATEGVPFVDHAYPSSLFRHGQRSAPAKTVEQIDIERGSVGNSMLHVRKDAEGVPVARGGGGRARRHPRAHPRRGRHGRVGPVLRDEPAGGPRPTRTARSTSR